jgi:hypothetical protein
MIIQAWLFTTERCSSDRHDTSFRGILHRVDQYRRVYVRIGARRHRFSIDKSVRSGQGDRHDTFSGDGHDLLPQALRNILPQIGNNLIINIKDTAVLNIITVPELFFAAKTLTGSYYQYFQTYFIDCAVYFILTFTCSRLLRMYERKLDGPDSYNLAGTGGKPAPGKRPTGVTMQLMSGRLREQRSAMR